MSTLKQINLFSDLTDSELDYLSLFCQNKVLSQWDILFQEWDDANAMYILINWEINIFNTSDGKNVKLWTIQAEDILGEMALFWKSKTRMATAIASTDVELLTVLSFSMKELTDKYPELLKKIKRIIEERTVNNKIIEAEIKG